MSEEIIWPFAFCVKQPKTWKSATASLARQESAMIGRVMVRRMVGEVERVVCGDWCAKFAVELN